MSVSDVLGEPIASAVREDVPAVWRHCFRHVGDFRSDGSVVGVPTQTDLWSAGRRWQCARCEAAVGVLMGHTTYVTERLLDELANRPCTEGSE